GKRLFVGDVAWSVRAESPEMTEGRGATFPDLEALLGEIPGSLRGAIEKQIHRVGPRQQRVLEAASVAGMEFSAGEVAAALGEDVAEVDALCAALARRGPVLRGLGGCAWPGGAAARQDPVTHAPPPPVPLGFAPHRP